jgi:hypothetical protein
MEADERKRPVIRREIGKELGRGVERGVGRVYQEGND